MEIILWVAQLNPVTVLTKHNNVPYLELLNLVHSTNMTLKLSGGPSCSSDTDIKSNAGSVLDLDKSHVDIVSSFWCCLLGTATEEPESFPCSPWCSRKMLLRGRWTALRCTDWAEGRSPISTRLKCNKEVSPSELSRRSNVVQEVQDLWIEVQSSLN